MGYDVLVYGPVFCDLVFTGLPGMPVLGQEHYARDLTVAPGGSAIVAVGLQRLGVCVGLVADLGNDPLSRVLWNLLDEYGLDRSLIRRLDQPLPQVTVALSFPGDRAFVTRFQHPEEPVDLSSILERHPVRHVHIGSFLPLFQQPGVCRLIREAGASVSLDPGWDEGALRDPKLMKAVPDLDFFLPSRSELCWMADEEDPGTAARKILGTMQRGTVVMKDGRLGAAAYTMDRPAGIHVPALPVEALETTGAGDAFDAGFIAALLEGRQLEECVRRGVVCGSLAVKSSGGPASLPDKEELEQWVSRLQL